MIRLLNGLEVRVENCYLTYPQEISYTDHSPSTQTENKSEPCEFNICSSLKRQRDQTLANLYL